MRCLSRSSDFCLCYIDIMLMRPRHGYRTGRCVLLNSPSHVSTPQTSEWHDGLRCLVYEKLYSHRVRALNKTGTQLLWLICNRMLIEQCDLMAANGLGPSDNCSLARLLIGQVGDLEQ